MYDVHVVVHMVYICYLAGVYIRCKYGHVNKACNKGYGLDSK